MTQVPSPAECLRLYGRPAKKRLGQNFLTDANVLDRIVAAGAVQPGTRVLEIGPGPGGLTSRLLASGADVVCIEPDDDAVAHLRAVFPAQAPLRVVHGDALGPELDGALEDPPRTVIANLPYHVATEIMFRLVDRDRPPQRMALMFQREVARRIATDGPDREMSALSVAVAIRYERRVVMTLPPGAFTPAPKVHSCVVRFVLRDTPLADAAVEERTRALATAAFQQRRKMLRNGLQSVVDDPIALLERADIAPTMRPEALGIDAWVRLGEAALGQGGAA